MSTIALTATESVLPNDAHVRVTGLDALRGLAIVLVLAYHMAGVTFVPNGSYGLFGTFFDTLWIGVDVFFVLSGFLITTGLLEARGRLNYFRNFYIKRSFRLLPLYYFAFFAFLAIPMVWKTHPSVGLVLCYVLYVQNWTMAAGHWIKGTAHFWSLAIEEQFYVFWPSLCHKISTKKVFWASVSLFICSFFARLALRFLTPITPWPIYTMTITHLDGIALGSALAAVLADGRSKKRLSRIALPTFWISLGVLIVLILTLPRDQGNLDVYTWLPAVTSIWSASAITLILERRLLFEGLLGKVFQRYGLYSYSIYLFHPFFVPFLYVKKGKFAFNTPAFLARQSSFKALLFTVSIFLGFLLGSFIFGHLVYRFVESPLLKARGRFLPLSSQLANEKAVADVYAQNQTDSPATRRLG